eukprot:6208833-Pleurochrysis_carterae.AAC.2
MANAMNDYRLLRHSRSMPIYRGQGNEKCISRVKFPDEGIPSIAKCYDSVFTRWSRLLVGCLLSAAFKNSLQTISYSAHKACGEKVAIFLSSVRKQHLHTANTSARDVLLLSAAQISRRARDSSCRVVVVGVALSRQCEAGCAVVPPLGWAELLVRLACRTRLLRLLRVLCLLLPLGRPLLLLVLDRRRHLDRPTLEIGAVKLQRLRSSEASPLTPGFPKEQTDWSTNGTALLKTSSGDESRSLSICGRQAWTRWHFWKVRRACRVACEAIISRSKSDGSAPCALGHQCRLDPQR